MVDLVVDLVTNMMNYWGSSNMDCWGGISNNRNTSYRNNSGESTNDWCMVDHMVGGVCGGVLLYGDLGYMVDLVVDLVTNMMNYWGSSNMDCWSGISNSGNWCSFYFHSLNCSNSRGSNHRGSRDYSCSIGKNRSSLHLNSLYLRNNWS